MIPGFNILKKIFKTSNERKLIEIQPLVQKINSLEPQIQKLSDQELKDKTQEFKKRIKNGENLNKILPEAFSCVREASVRLVFVKQALELQDKDILMCSYLVELFFIKVVFQK